MSGLRRRPLPNLEEPLPGRRFRCRLCRAQLVFARTLASPRGTGGKFMPLDVMPNTAGNVAVRVVGAGRLVARVLGRDDVRDETLELPAMPHAATCAGSARQLGAEVEAWLRDQEEAE